MKNMDSETDAKIFNVVVYLKWFKMTEIFNVDEAKISDQFNSNKKKRK